MKTKIIYLLILISISSFSKNEIEDEYISIQEILKKMAIESKRYLPKKIDNNLNFTKIESQENKLVFYYTVGDTYSISDLKKNTISLVCNNKSWIFYLKNGISLEYLYFDKNDYLLGKYIIKPSTCKFH